MLLVVDAARKVSTLRPWFPEDRVVSVEFPLYNRFKRGKSRHKLNTWPDLKPVPGEIASLQKIAHGQDVLGIFDDTEYGRVQARDLSEALKDLNNQVSFKFVAAYTREAVDAAPTVTSVPTDCDLRYMFSRLFSQQIDDVLEMFCGSDGDVVCTWQQAYLIGEIKRMTRDCRVVDVASDEYGRELVGTFDETSPNTIKAYSATFKPIRLNILGLARTVEDLDEVVPALEKLRAAGLVAVAETELTSPLFDDVIDDVVEYAEKLEIEGVGSPETKGFFVTDFRKLSSSFVESDFVKHVYDLIRQDTILACCGPVRATAVSASAQGLSTMYVHPERRTWLPLSGMPVTQVRPVVDASKVRRIMKAAAPTNKDLADSALAAAMTSRDLCSAVLYLLRRKYVVCRDGLWYLTSRGCLVAHVLELAFPVALTTDVSRKIGELVEYHNRETNNPVNIQQLETLGSFVEFIRENRRDVSLDDVWDSFAGKAEVHVSSSAAWVIESEADPEPKGIFYNGNTDEFEILPVGSEVFDPCPCGGSDVVNTGLSPTYESVTECPACGVTRPLVGVPEKDA